MQFNSDETIRMFVLFLFSQYKKLPAACNLKLDRLDLTQNTGATGQKISAK